MDKKVGCVIVSYNVPEIISRAVNSIRDYVDEVVIIDSSSKDSPAYKEADSLGVTVKHTEKNVGHGNGLDMGIRMLDTEYVIIMDSDAEVKDGTIVQDLLNLMEDDVYGVGKTFDNISRWVGAPYLHPYFALIRRSSYLKYHPICNGAAPTAKAMQSIKGKMRVVSTDMSKVWHQNRATRDYLKKKR
jgi:GT2 family glycosyltransferase